MATQAATLSRPVTPASAGLLLPAFTLWWREIVRFYRQKSRVVGVLASPLVFWVVLGSGFGNSFRSAGGQGQQHYMDYFYPGTLILIVLFTSIFAMMSLIEDRKEGFLLSVMVAPVPRSAIVLGKVLGGTTLSAVQGMIFLRLRTVRRRTSTSAASFAGCPRGFAGFVRADRAGLRHRLAHGFHLGFPWHHQSVSDSAVAIIGRSVSPVRRFGVDSLPDVYEPAHLRGRGAA